MSERRGLLLIGSERQQVPILEHAEYFGNAGIDTVHRYNINDHLSLGEIEQLENHRTGDRLSAEGEKLLATRMGYVANLASAFLVVNTVPDGDEELRIGDITLNEYKILISKYAPRDRFALAPIPADSPYHRAYDQPAVGDQLGRVVDRVRELDHNRGSA